MKSCTSSSYPFDFRVISHFSRVILFLLTFPAFAEGPAWWTARNVFSNHWLMAFGKAPTFTNPPGSQADLNDMRDALNALSGKFYTIGK
jgi:hypothetical protein